MYSGNYSLYKEEKEKKHQQKQAEYEAYVKKKNQLIQAAKQKEAAAGKLKSAPSRMGNSEARLHKLVTRQKQGDVAKRGQRLMARAERLEAKEKPKDAEVISFNIQHFRLIPGKRALQLSGIEAGFNEARLFKPFSTVVRLGTK